MMRSEIIYVLHIYVAFWMTSPIIVKFCMQKLDAKIFIDFFSEIDLNTQKQRYVDSLCYNSLETPCRTTNCIPHRRCSTVLNDSKSLTFFTYDSFIQDSELFHLNFHSLHRMSAFYSKRLVYRLGTFAAVIWNFIEYIESTLNSVCSNVTPDDRWSKKYSAE